LNVSIIRRAAAVAGAAALFVPAATAANPASAPANECGTSTAGLAHTFGGLGELARVVAQEQLVADLNHTDLGLTPPGNTPPPGLPSTCV
jgi:hypothetical protein